MRLGQGRKGGLGSISGKVCLLLHVFGAIIAGDRDALMLTRGSIRPKKIYRQRILGQPR